MRNQTDLILARLKEGPLTPMQALRSPIRCARLAARILDLRRRGYEIDTDMVKRRSKRTGRSVAFARYSLAGGDK